MSEGGIYFKLASCCCLVLALSVSISFMCFYWSLYNTTVQYDALDTAPTNYDGCGLDSTEVPAYLVNGMIETGWTQVFRFNAIMYTIIVSFVGVAMLCLAVPACSGVTLCCAFCAVTPLFAAIILTGVRRFNSNGDLCASSTAISNSETLETFMDNAATLKALFIA